MFDRSEKCWREPRCEASLAFIFEGVQHLPNRSAIVQGADEWNSQTRDEITDIERASEARARLEESRALIAQHRPRVTAPRTYAGQDQIQHGARQRMHASRLHSRELMANLATMRGDVGTAGCGRAVTRGLLLR